MRFLNELLCPVHLIFFGGGKQALPPETRPSPPVTRTNATVVAEAMEARKSALRRKGFGASMFAGRFGNGLWQPTGIQMNTPEGGSLLGGRGS